MRYIPNTDSIVEEMLGEIGVDSVRALLRPIPDSLILDKPLDLPSAMSESDIVKHMAKITSLAGIHLSFLGGGYYDHLIPAAVKHIIGRSEFYTAYTPYQPEISQGTLQAIYEFQTMICQLTGMELANASMYDGASALAEAAIMAVRISKKKEIILPENIHPEYRETVKTYCRFLDIVIKEIPVGSDGRIDVKVLKENISADTAAVAVQNPNFFGVVEGLEEISAVIKDAGALFIGVVVEPVSLGILKPPGDFGADIVVGEGQAFGNPMNFGGPGVGFFASRDKYMRQMPGRLIGQTVDKNGKRGYVLTLSTREQHIRREKATSNICSNQSLCALAAAVHLSLLGKGGLKKVALLNLRLADYAKEKLGSVKGCKLRFSSQIFNEFVVELPIPAEEFSRRLLLEKNIVGGLPLGRFFKGMEKSLLVTLTEKISKEDIDTLTESLNGLLNGGGGQ
ncbi:MAG: aminomethyl-transferring glycine dehydrogenase subunit GcvPA [Nitrospinota bacterium]|nr:aminomethyl-transferring glycine dehydrogenase subunit GcvPA [Nitrospinota bacterium]